MNHAERYQHGLHAAFRAVEAGDLSFVDRDLALGAISWALRQDAHAGNGTRHWQLRCDGCGKTLAEHTRLGQCNPTYLIRAKFSDDIEIYLDVRAVHQIGSGKVGIDVAMPDYCGSPLQMCDVRANLGAEDGGEAQKVPTLTPGEAG